MVGAASAPRPDGSTTLRRDGDRETPPAHLDAGGAACEAERMSVGSKVLVATDLSDAADEAIRQGHEEALASGGELVPPATSSRTCCVRPRSSPSSAREASTRTLALEESAAQAIVARVAAVTGRETATFRVHVDTGAPDAGIVRAADEVHASLVVVGSRGATGLERLLLGSVAARVVRYAHAPVLVARPHAKTGRVLAATDFSDAALPARTFAAEEARRRGARLTLLHSLDVLPSPAIGFGAPFGATWVVPPKELLDQARAGVREALQGMLQRFGVDGDILATEGDAAAAILDAARTLPAELVVVATRGRTGIARMVLGSVAERVVEHAECSVLAVRLAG